MRWTGPGEIRTQLERLWERGAILEAHLRGEERFPLRLRTSRPGPRDLSERFEEVRAWIRALEAGAKASRGFGYEIDWVEVTHRQLGRNRIPTGAVVPSEQDALELLGKRKQAETVYRLAGVTAAEFPGLKAWLADHPMKLLDSAADWERMLGVIRWFRDHPRPGVYMRQLEVPAVDTKFVESRRALISQLLDQVLPDEAIDRAATGAASFERRYGLRSKPGLIRFRVLDERLRVGGLSDLATPEEEFARLELPASRVFFTENEINGLAFPSVPDSVVIFGLGYRVDRLARIDWLRSRILVYWGDIDTHGFAILDRLRRSFPDVRSLLMDRETLLAHRALWGREDEPHEGDLSHLTEDERVLYEDLRSHRLGANVRLEQERIGFEWVRRALRPWGA